MTFTVFERKKSNKTIKSERDIIFYITPREYLKRCRKKYLRYYKFTPPSSRRTSNNNQTHNLPGAH